MSLADAEYAGKRKETGEAFPDRNGSVVPLEPLWHLIGPTPFIPGLEVVGLAIAGAMLRFLMAENWLWLTRIAAMDRACMNDILRHFAGLAARFDPRRNHHPQLLSLWNARHASTRCLGRVTVTWVTWAYAPQGLVDCNHHFIAPCFGQNADGSVIRRCIDKKGKLVLFA